MIFYDYYADIPETDLREFVTQQELGHLCTVGADGQPHAGLYPFLFLGETIEMHLHRSDEQLADLHGNVKCAFEVSEILGAVPSHWSHAENAMFATAYHRTVIFECDAALSTDGEVLAAQQERLMRHYQPEGGYRPVSTMHAMYRNGVTQIAAVTLTVRARKVKWKLAQNRKPELRREIIAQLRSRGRSTDLLAADAIQWTLDQPR